MPNLFSLQGVVVYVTIVFLNAFVDLGHKIIVQNTLFKTLDGSEQIIMTSVLNALILLPLALLFTPSGFVSDRFAKPKVMQKAAWAAVLLTLAITACYYTGQFKLAFVMTLLMAVQSAMYSPAKYGYVRELIGKSRLSQGNALVQAVTVVAILGGTFFFSVLFERLYVAESTGAAEILTHVAPIGWVLVLSSVIELILSYRLPAKPAAAAELKFDWQQYTRGRYLRQNTELIYNDKTIWICIIGLSLFWGISQVMVAAFPAHAKWILDEGNTIVVQGVLACSGLGIIFGATIAGRLSANYIETGFIPLGAVGIAAMLFVISGLNSAIGFGIAFFVLGVMSGFFIVPLNSLIQFHAAESQLARVLAGNNLIQTLVMLGFLAATAVVAMFEVSSIKIFFTLGLIATGGAIYTVWRLPQSLVRFLIARGFGFKYRMHVLGLDKLPSTGGVLLLGNHVSFVDWAIVGIACPRRVRFVMHREYYSKWYLRWFFDLVGCIPISSGNSKDALAAVNTSLNSGEVVCLFPEGTLTRNGQLGEFKRGFERAAENSNAVIIPFYIQGLWGSRFSRAEQGKNTEQTEPGKRDVTVAFGDNLVISSNAEVVKQRVMDLSTHAWQAASEHFECIGREWVATACAKPKALCIAELHGAPLSNAKALAAAVMFSRRITRASAEQTIGLILPAGIGGILTNMAGWLSGKTVVNLNYTASHEALKSAIEKAGIKHVYSSTRFLEKLKDRGVDLSPLLDDVQVHHLETLKAQISKVEGVLTYLMVRYLPVFLVQKLFAKYADPGTPAAILFSSGSEGAPKGVMLSHRNLLINVKQVSSVLNANDTDRIMGTLPIFHAFGLTATTLLPLIEGLPVICHPDPTDTSNIAKAIAKFEGTVLFGTSTFLRLYNKNRRIKPILLDSLRLVVAGAEKLSPDVASAFKEKFGKAVYEGFGATETAPVAAVNLPDLLDRKSLKVLQGGRAGTVGMPVPGTSFRVVDPATMTDLGTEQDGLVLISGPQVMLGYLQDEEKTANAIVDLDGQRWYKTGDKGRVDKDGYLTIVDRFSRFAKLGGEMVSLGAVEETVRKTLTDSDCEVVAVALPDEKKGERVVLLVSSTDAENIRQQMLDAKCNPLMIPSVVISVDELPKLGTGKTDFAGAKALASAA